MPLSEGGFGRRPSPGLESFVLSRAQVRGQKNALELLSHQLVGTQVQVPRGTAFTMISGCSEQCLVHTVTSI